MIEISSKSSNAETHPVPIGADPRDILVIDSTWDYRRDRRAEAKCSHGPIELLKIPSLSGLPLRRKLGYRGTPQGGHVSIPSLSGFLFDVRRMFEVPRRLQGFNPLLIGASSSTMSNILDKARASLGFNPLLIGASSSTILQSGISHINLLGWFPVPFPDENQLIPFRWVCQEPSNPPQQGADGHRLPQKADPRPSVPFVRGSTR